MRHRRTQRTKDLRWIYCPLRGTVEVCWIRPEINYIERIRNDAQQEYRGVFFGEKDDRGGDQRAKGRADLAPRSGTAVCFGFFGEPSLAVEPIENHGLVRTGSECRSQGEEEHGGEHGRKPVGEAENQEGYDISDERGYHRTPAAQYVGDRAGGNFREIDRNCAEADQHADGREREALLTQGEKDKWIEVLLILQETV